MNDWEVARSLDIAQALIGLGVPVFLAQPDPSATTGYRLPGRWQDARPDECVIDDWRPGMALGMVTGHVFDLVDIDPRSGGKADPTWMPDTYLIANTPSGGQHYFVACLGVESRDGVFPGVDLKSGTPEGRGRGFAFIAPTVRVSKVDGQPRFYHWRYDVNLNPDPDDESGAVLRERVRKLRDLGRRIGEQPRRIPRSVARAEWDRACTRLAADVRYWAAHGWGGEAHAGLLAHTTHLARLEPDHAEVAFINAFTAAGCEPDEADLTKLASALDNAVPDEVVDDELMDPQELFWAGAAVFDESEDPAERRARAALSASGWSEREAAMIMTARRWRDAH